MSWAEWEIAVMAKTVTCLFNSESEASSVVRQLENSGISHGKICQFSNTGTNRFWEGTSSFDERSGGAGHDRVEHYLMNNGVPQDDAYAYAEGVRRGHTLVAVQCDDDEVNEVVGILDNDGVLDLDERQESWRSEGWTGYGAGMMGAADSATTPATGMTGSSMRDRDDMYNRDKLQGRDEVIPVAEEELHVGKRDVSHGRVRIRSHVVERPVQEQVSLTEEHVSVERRPVDGSMRTAARGGDLFRERTIEAEERSEEAVVSKEARVVEEVVVRKDSDQRTETVSDTVRKTEIEVEDERGSSISKTGTTDRDR
jgi:uncharacterized protein (TIGR02271 family)